MPPPQLALFLNGSYGVGKSSVLEHLADLFAARSWPFSLFDVDWFHRSWPVAVDDPRNVLIEAENMRAVWENYRRVGPRTPIIAGVIASEDDHDRYAAIFGLPLRIVHLTASPPVAERRLRGRYDEDRSPVLEWHLADRARLAAQLDGAPWHDLTIDTDGLKPRQVAQLVLDELGPGAGA